MTDIQSRSRVSEGPEPRYCDDPVFILASSRSGSTLLRFILDAHPELACPPETNITGAALHLLRSWSVLETASGPDRAREKPGSASTPVPVPVVDAVRHTLDLAYSRYLGRRGKKRWCDKSIETPMYASILTALYPKARFLCLYRHCMDVIASGIEICPWGLNGFGFSAYAAQNPGNDVEAIGSYWSDCSRLIFKYETEHRDRCYRLRYEDLVADPETVIAGVFSFLGVAQRPGITHTCFEVPHEERGPGDDKIWFTNRISSSSVGSGRRIPAALLSTRTLGSVNQLLAELRYPVVDEGWNRAQPGRGETGPGGEPEAAQAVAREIKQLIRKNAAAQKATERWPGVAGRSVWIVAEEDTASASVRHDFPGTPAGTPARIAASAQTWHLLLSGNANLATLLRRGDLTCSDADGNRQWGRSELLQATSWLLGLAAGPSWGRPQESSSGSPV